MPERGRRWHSGPPGQAEDVFRSGVQTPAADEGMVSGQKIGAQAFDTEFPAIEGFDFSGAYVEGRA